MQFVPGEVMAKFTSDSEANRLLSEATRSTPPNIELLAPVARLLGDKTGIPLQIKQILSGGWVLLIIDANKLANQAAEKLRQQHGVDDAQLRPVESKGLGLVDVRAVDITFRKGTRELKIIEDMLAGANDEKFAGLIGQLEKNVGLPLQGTASGPAHLAVEIDLRPLTTLCAERLQTHSEIIESVQLNYMKTGG